MRGNEITDNLARDGSIQWFVGHEPFLGVSRQNIRKMKHWMEKQCLVLWHGPCSTQTTGWRIDLWTRPGYKGPIIVL